MKSLAVEIEGDIIESFYVRDPKDELYDAIEEFITEFNDIEILNRKYYQEYDITLRCESEYFLFELQSFLEERNFI